MPRLLKTTVVFVSAVILVLVTAGVAAAHVTVNPKAVAGGSYTQLTFRAPNEEAKAAFMKLTVHLPAEHPLGSVSTRPMTGWNVRLTTAKLPKPITTDDGAVTEYTNSITWTATNGGVPPEQYQNFDVSVGPLPAGGTMVFRAEQTYSDGTVVHWDQAAKAGAQEPEHPAPVLTLTSAAGPESAATTPSSSDGVARGLGIAALVVAVLAAGAALLSRRRRTGP